MHGCQLVLDYSKVNISSCDRFVKLGMEIIHGPLIHIHHFLLSRFRVWSKTEEFWQSSCQKHVCLWLWCVAMPFQSQYQSMDNVHEALDGNHGWLSSPTRPFFAKLIPMLEHNRSWRQVTTVLPPISCTISSFSLTKSPGSKS